jgi:hypothetical protein
MEQAKSKAVGSQFGEVVVAEELGGASGPQSTTPRYHQPGAVGESAGRE